MNKTRAKQLSRAIAAQRPQNYKRSYRQFKKFYTRANGDERANLRKHIVNGTLKFENI